MESVKRWAAYTDEQQSQYAALQPRQRKYVDFRVAGYNKTDSYIKAGYKRSNTTTQAAYMLERSHAHISDLIEARVKVKRAKEVFKADSETGQKIDALAIQKKAEDILAVIEGADPETIAQIKFYRDIVDGKIGTTKKTKFIDKSGAISWKIEKIDDVDARMKARRELDKILGINKVVDLGEINMGDITINIVDASKKDIDSVGIDKEGFKGFEKVKDEVDVVEIDDGDGGVMEISNETKNKGKIKEQKFERRIVK